MGLREEQEAVRDLRIPLHVMVTFPSGMRLKRC